tara:strand:+ start:263 stop:454 length:192 start_codon:yes stop_codon:yes gene_type:complete
MNETFETSEETFVATPFEGSSSTCERVVIGLAMTAQLLAPDQDPARRDNFVMVLAALAETAEA